MIKYIKVRKFHFYKFLKDGVTKYIRMRVLFEKLLEESQVDRVKDTNFISVVVTLPSRGGRYKLRVDMEHLQGIFITQNVHPLIILWLKEQSSAIVVVW